MRSILLGVVKLVLLIAVAGGTGVALGYGLANVSDEKSAATVGGTATTSTTRTATPARATQTATAATATTTATATTPARTAPTRTQTQTTTTGTPRDGLELRVLGAILRPASTESGIRRNRARITMRVRAENRGPDPATPGLPSLRIGDSTVRPDSNALTPETELGELAPGAAKAVTLRFELVGSTTANVTRDRRADILFAGRAKPVRIAIGAPVHGAAD